MQLVVQSGMEPGRTYDVASHKVTVGRQAGNDLVVPDEQVSRKHAEIEERGGVMFVTDLGSSNGTFVNGTRISSPQTLRSGDTVQIGTTVLKVADGAGAGAGAAFSTMPSGGYEQPASGGYSPSVPPAYAPPADYGQAGGAGYAQPSAYNQPQGYAQPGGYGQPPATDYGQAGGAGYAQPGYSPNQPQGYAPQPGFAAMTAPKKGNNLLPVLIGVGLLAVILVVVLVIFLGGSGGGSDVGDLPAPKNSTKIDLPKDFEKNFASIPNVDASKLKFGLYTSKDSPATILSFYKDEMKKKGWSDTFGGLAGSSAGSAAANSSFFTKSDQLALVQITEVKSQTDVDKIVKDSPQLKDKVKVGDNLVVLVQTPFTLPK